MKRNLPVSARNLISSVIVMGFLFAQNLSAVILASPDPYDIPSAIYDALLVKNIQKYLDGIVFADSHDWTEKIKRTGKTLNILKAEGLNSPPRFEQGKTE